MPLIACPKCATNLKIPDGASGNVKCPKCSTIFSVGATTPAPAFEVVDDTPAAPPPQKPAPRRAAPEPDFEVVDEPKPRPKKKVTAVADDDDDDRPRSKRRRDDDEDDDEDRPRRKKKRHDDDDDWRPTSSRSSYGAAKVGMLLIVISLWLYLGTFALLALLLLIAWLGASIPTGLMIVPGLLGVANWVVALIGLGFCIAGPSRARGLAIATTAVAAVQIAMAFVVANDLKSGLFAAGSIQTASSYNRTERLMRLSKAAAKNPNGPEAKELQEEFKNRQDRDDDNSLLVGMLQFAGSQATKSDQTDLDRVLREKKFESKMRWLDLATLFPFFDRLIAVLSYNSNFFSDYVLAFLSGAVEVARLILLILTIGAVARAVKAHDAADKATVGVIAAAIAFGVALLVTLLIYVMLDSNASDLKKAFEKAATNPPSASSSDKDPFQDFMRGAKNWACAGDLLLYLMHGGVLVLPIIAAHGAYSVAARRAR